MKKLVILCLLFSALSTVIAGPKWVKLCPNGQEDKGQCPTRPTGTVIS